MFVLGFFLRVALAFLPGFKIDMDAWYAWSVRLAELGPVNFYSDQIWTNYTPGFLYILWILGIIKSLVNIPDAIYLVLLKMPGIVTELAIAFIAAKYFLKEGRRKFFLLFFLLNPALIFNSTLWGQIDSLLSLFMLLSVISLIKKNLILSALFFALACLIKPQAMTLAPIFGLYFLSNFDLMKILKFAGVYLASLWTLSLPFFAKNPILGFADLFVKMINDYPYTSLFAYNLWGALTGFWIDDQKIFYLLSYQNIGILLLLGTLSLLGFLYFKKRLSLLALSVLVLLSFYFLPTRVHDRYIYPALIFLIIYSFRMKKNLFIFLTSLLCVFSFLNLYQVYIYYNHFYLNIPMPLSVGKLGLYLPQLYNILSGNGSNLSWISTAIFLLITLAIIKTDAYKKKI